MHLVVHSGYARGFSPEQTFERSTILASAPIELRDAFERYLYELGKCVLQKYACFEE